MYDFEKPGDPIEEENKSGLSENEDLIREEFADKLEYIVSEDSDLPDKIREGEKAGWSRDAKDALLDAAKEFGFGHDDIEELEEIFLEEKDEDF